MNSNNTSMIREFHTGTSPNDVGPNGQWYGNEDYAYAEDGDVGGVAGDADANADGTEREPKRRRINKACAGCRRRKIKCNGEQPCSGCKAAHSECFYSQEEKKRAPPKGAKYIEGLENRLGRMENLLRLSGLLAEDDDQTDLRTLEKKLQERNQSKSAAASPQSQPSTRAGSHVTSPPEAAKIATPASYQSPGNKEPEQRNPKEVDALADQMCSLITNHSGETRYIGSSSGFSIFSPKGIQWVNTKTGDNSFEQMIASAAANEQKWDHWRPEVFDDIFGRRVFKQLPSKQECLSLLKDFFANFNCMFPLFHEPTFMHLVEKHYSLDPYEGSGWWASLNVALAIAHRLRVMSNVVDHGEDEQAWGYLKNAMAVMTELTMRNTDLLSVQALLGMSLFLQGTPNPQPSFFLVAAAVRLSHSIGLHKRGSGFHLNEVETEQRKRVFWIAYQLDKDICLRSGRPPAQDDDDMNVDLPSEDPPDNVGNIPLNKPTADGKTTMNLFRLMCTFAQIQSRVYKQLYSVKASRQSDGELLNTIGDLDQALEEWKDGIPLDFRPEHDIRANHTALIVHVVVLHFAYYNCLTTIHRMSVHHGYWTRGLGDYALQGLNARPLNPRVFMSAALCVNAARTSIGLIRYIPQGDSACVWLILYYPVSSLVTLFANILQNPQDTRARSDLRLMSSVVNFLTILEHDVQEQNSNVRRMLQVCAEFERIAKVVLDRAEREMKGRGKRKQAERERERDKANGAISAELDEGKTIEQIQIETQAAYRRPVQTPGLQSASLAGSSVGGASPASWKGSQAGGDISAGKIDQSNGFANSNVTRTPEQVNGAFAPPMASGAANPNILQQYGMNAQMRPPQARNPGDFTQPQQSLTDGFNAPGSVQPNINNPLADISIGNTYLSPDMNTGLTESFSGSFQQPFVPQDLWSMSMSLEWDMYEGMGLGSFTPGPGPMNGPVITDDNNMLHEQYGMDTTNYR